MLYLKTTKETITKSEVTLEFPLIDKYFWCSRSVYAVEFFSDIYHAEGEDEPWYEMKLTEVKFEENIIRVCTAQWCHKYPFTLSHLSYNWERELFDAYVNSRYDSRTKGQFEADFNKVIENLQKLRSWRYNK
jgi:hypothetical protein